MIERQTLPRRTAVAFDRHGRAGVAREHETQPRGRRTHTSQLGTNESEGGEFGQHWHVMGKRMPELYLGTLRALS